MRLSKSEVTRHQQSAVKIMAPFNDGRKEMHLGFLKIRLKLDNWAEIRSPGSENLDQTNASINDGARLSPNKSKSMVETPVTQSAIYALFPTYDPPLPTFKANTGTESSLNPTHNTYNSLLHHHHLVPPRYFVQPSTDIIPPPYFVQPPTYIIPLLPVIGDASEKRVDVNPSSTGFNVKRSNGRGSSEVSIRNYIKTWSIKVTLGQAETPITAVKYKDEEMALATEEFCSMFFNKMEEVIETVTTVKIWSMKVHQS